MSELIIFAGTFDPFHRGHRAILESALAALPGARALVAPARIPRWRATPSLSYERRLEIARRSIVGLAAEVIEEPDAVDRTALDLVLAVRRNAPDEALFYLVGADVAAGFPGWHGREQFLSVASLLIAPRAGTDFALDALIERDPILKGRARLLPATGVEASATRIREGALELLVEGIDEAR